MRSFSSLLAMSYLILSLAYINYGLKLINILQNVRELVSYKYETEMNRIHHVGPPPGTHPDKEDSYSSSGSRNPRHVLDNIPQRFRISTIEKANLL